MMHPFITFRAEREACQLLQSNSQGVGIFTPSTQSDSESEVSLPPQFSDSLDWESDVSVGVVFKKFFANMTSTNQVEQEEVIELFDTDPWA